MRPSVGKKLSLFAALLVALSAGAMGYVCYTLLERKLADNLRKDTLDASALLASRVRGELRHVAEKARILASAALEEFRSPEDQIRFLEGNIALDDQLVAMSLYRRSKASQGKWTPVFRLTRPEDDEAFLEENDFRELDLKYPLDFKAVAEGAIEVTVGTLGENAPLLRMAVPLVRNQDGDFTQILGIELRQERITAAFAEATAHFSYLLDRNGRVLVQTDPTHFTFGEDLSQLPILQMARATEAPNGNLDFYELPGAMLQYGSFNKVGYADLVVVSQASKSHLIHALREFTRQALFVVLGCAFAAAALMLLASWSVVGARLARVSAAFARVTDGKFAVSFPEKHSADEVGNFAMGLQEVCDRLEKREKVHGTFAKLKSKKVKSRIEEGRINFKGERTEAIVMHCHLHGIEAVIAKADPELLLRLLNEFNQGVSEAVESNQGIVDHIHGGSVVAYWGVPLADKRDSDHALSSCLEVRNAAKALNEALKREGLPEVQLAVGVHHGPVVAGQVGAEGRMEYTAFGEAIEVAARIRNFTDQFGTDILITGPALAHAPQWYSTEKVAPADGANPELYELHGKARQAA